MYLCLRHDGGGGMPLSRPYMERNQAATTTPWQPGGKNNIFEVKLIFFSFWAMLVMDPLYIMMACLAYF